MKYEDYVETGYNPSKKDLICYFYVEPRKESIKKAAGAVAAESSTGTWTKLTTVKPYMAKLGAKVFSVKKKGKGANIKIAYPNELFEADNLPNIMSSIAGNIFGMKEVKNLRLNDIIFPRNIAKAYKGPKFGIKKIRKIFRSKKRPLIAITRPFIGTIVKPKLGLNTKDHAKVAYHAWLGGCDIVKDDENLSSQSFNRFYERLKQTLKLKRRAEKITGEKKAYMINITAETEEMIKRAKAVQKSGNEYLMVDIITTGWSALQTLRNHDFNLVHHAHRAGHAAFDRDPKHGISMKVISRLTRMVGMDQLHIGTAAIGKMFETRKECLDNVEALTDDFYGIKKTFPVASGGLQPGMMPKLYKTFGKDVIIQLGGGIHGHPEGTLKGAMAARQALEATVKNIPLREYAKKHPELNQAIRLWGIPR